MKNLSTALSALALIGVLVLFGMHFSKNDKKAATESNTKTSVETFNSTGKIAYVNIDTLQANYLYLRNEKKKFEKRQSDMMAELAKSAQKMQDDYTAMQRKMQAGTLTPAEKEAGEKRLMQMDESYRTRKDALVAQLGQEQEDFNKKLQAELDAFLAEYNKDKKFDYILSYAQGGSIMFANKSLDITQDVLNGMNARNPVVNEGEKKNK